MSIDYTPKIKKVSINILVNYNQVVQGNVDALRDAVEAMGGLMHVITSDPDLEVDYDD